MSAIPTRRRALLIIDEGAAIHNRALVERLASTFDLSTIRISGRARTTSRRQLLLQEIALLTKPLLWRNIYGRDGVVVAGSGHYAALAAARLLRPFGRNARVFVYNLYLHGLSRNALVRRVLSSLLTRDVAVVGQSNTDTAYFASASGEPTLFLVPYGQDPVENIRPEDIQLGDYVFAGGYSNRDYARLFECAARLEGIRFVVACSHLNTLPAMVPENVEVYRDLASPRFHQLLAGARLVVVPLAEDVGASGQMVTLAAMQLGKAIIVPNLSATAQYVEPGVSGLTYEHESTDALCHAITAVFDDREKLSRLGLTAQKQYGERFTLAGFTSGLIESLLEFIDRPSDANQSRTEPGAL